MPNATHLSLWRGAQGGRLGLSLSAWFLPHSARSGGGLLHCWISHDATAHAGTTTTDSAAPGGSSGVSAGCGGCLVSPRRGFFWTSSALPPCLDVDQPWDCLPRFGLSASQYTDLLSSARPGGAERVPAGARGPRARASPSRSGSPCSSLTPLLITCASRCRRQTRYGSRFFRSPVSTARTLRGLLIWASCWSARCAHVGHRARGGLQPRAYWPSSTSVARGVHHALRTPR